MYESGAHVCHWATKGVHDAPNVHASIQCLHLAWKKNMIRKSFGKLGAN